ncbi:MAG: hypothetical protein K2N72_01310 [Oscillospiraceae bacterium]|nr:hypothetical protein [Oscillospiraceae bacterium]
MKTFKTLLSLAAALTITAAGLSVTAKAYVPLYPQFSEFYYTADNTLTTHERIEVWQQTNADKDFTVIPGQKIRIEPLPEGSSILSVTEGANAVIKGEIFVERGGVLEIDNGTVTIDGGSIINCGTIKIGPSGTLNILSGTLESTAAGAIENSGKITCLDIGKNLGSIFVTMQKKHSSFNLDDYALTVTIVNNGIANNGTADIATVSANYCINDIMTNYKYYFTLAPGEKKVSIYHTDLSEETVFDPALAQKLSDRVTAFERATTHERNFGRHYWKNFGYTYDYNSDALTYSAKWVKYDYPADVFTEETFSGNA